MLREPTITLDLIRSVMGATPLERSKRLSDRYGAEIYLKREDLTPVRSYKLRGAFCFIASLSPEERAAGVVCASAGNHAQGVAFACRHFAIPARVFMPVTAPNQKIERTEILGGGWVTVELVGDSFDESDCAARAWIVRNGGTFVSPFDDERIIAGQATVTREILIDRPDLELLVVPVGGGGLAAGAVSELSVFDRVGVLRCAESSGAASLALSLEEGRPVELPSMSHFVDGAAVRRIGKKTFELLQTLDREQVIQIDENRLCCTILEFLRHDGIVLEPAGALSIDALQDLDVEGRTVVCVVSGGNLDFSRLPEIEERAGRATGKKRYLLLRLPQRPGALREFLAQLGPDDDIVRFEYLKKSSRNFGSVLVGLESSDPGARHELDRRLTNAGYSFRDVSSDALLADLLL